MGIGRCHPLRAKATCHQTGRCWNGCGVTARGGKLEFGAAGGDRTHFWVKPLATRATVGLRKIQQVKKALKSG